MLDLQGMGERIVVGARALLLVSTLVGLIIELTMLMLVPGQFTTDLANLIRQCVVVNAIFIGLQSTPRPPRPGIRA